MKKLKFKEINTILNYINDNNNYDSCIIGNCYKYYDIYKIGTNNKKYCIDIYKDSVFFDGVNFKEYNKLIDYIIDIIFEEGDYINIYQHENTED